MSDATRIEGPYPRELFPYNGSRLFVTGNRKEVLVIPGELANIFSVSTAEGYKEVQGYDVDKELRNRSISELENVLPMSSVKQYSNGDLSLHLKLGLDGGMLSVSQVVARLGEVNQLRGLSEALDQQLLQALTIQWRWNPNGTPAFKCAMAVTGSVMGASIGTVGSTLVCFALASNPIGWVVAGSAVTLGLTAGIVGWLYADHLLETENEQVRERAQEMRERFEAIFQAFAEIQCLKTTLDTHGQTDQERRDAKNKLSDVVSCLLQNLKHWKFVRISEYGLKLKIQKNTLNAAVRYYQPDDRANVLFAVKYLILVAMTELPRDQTPIDRILAYMRKLVDTAPESVDQEIITASNVQIGRLCINSNRAESAVQFFERVPPNSEFYGPVQQLLPQVRAEVRARQPALGNNHT